MAPPKAYKIVTGRLVMRCYEESDALLLKKSIDENLDYLVSGTACLRNA